jgi:hypothetical protein
MTEGGNIAKEAVTQVDISVDAATVARWLNCSPRMVRQYATNSSAGQLLSMADVEAVWGDLVTTTKWLFLVLPQRARMEVPGLTDAQHEGLMRLCRAMLSEVAIKGQAQLPGAGRHQEGRCTFS